jgi:hypothetical protein
MQMGYKWVGAGGRGKEGRFQWVSAGGPGGLDLYGCKKVNLYWWVRSTIHI